MSHQQRGHLLPPYHLGCVPHIRYQAHIVRILAFPSISSLSFYSKQAEDADLQLTRPREQSV